MAASRIVVVGAGVTGLTTARLLARNPSYSITVVAKHMPGDLSIEYASPWAGANVLPVSRAGSPAEQWDRDTWPEFARLAKDHPDAGVHFQETVVYNRTKDADGALGDWLSTLMEPEPWFKDLLPNFRPLNGDETRGFDYGTTFTSVCINTPVYLAWLVSQCLKAGVMFKRGIIKHISEAADMHHSGARADLIVNCTGLAAGKLGGVEDEAMLPGRGQTVLVRNEAGVMITTSGTDDGEDECTYVMQRAAGGGTILGGCFQKNNWNGEVDHDVAHRIMKRAVEVCPALTGGRGVEHLSVVRHNVGLRPLRVGGVRLEREELLGGLKIVHNYGHGGFGYQTSYGCSNVAVKLSAEALDTPSQLLA